MGAKVLIVEDDLDSLRLIGLMLEAKGYSIVAAQTGPQALDKAAEEAPDLIVLDLMIPGIDGYEVCRRLRAAPQTAAIPVIMLTARAQVADKVAGFEAGADEYLTKPIHPAELVTRIEALLARTVRLGAPSPAPQRAKVIGFLGCKGGVGTSTLVVNTGVMLAREPGRDCKVALVDFRRGKSTLALQLGLQVRGGLQTLLEHPAGTLDGEKVQAQMRRHTSGVLVLGGEVAPVGVLPLVMPSHATAIVGHLQAIADYVLIDMGADLDPVNQALLRSIGYVLVVIEPQRTALLLAQALLAGLDQLDFGRHRTGLIVQHRAPSAVTLSTEMVESFLQQEVNVIVPPAPELSFQAAETGTPMVLIQAGSTVATQLRQLTGFLAAL